jgi:4-nitrophenyl phosphatase
MAWVIDLDGVVRLGPRPVPGSAGAVARLRAAGEAVAFVTNNSSQTTAEVAAELEELGVPDAGPLVITSAMAVATLVAPGERVLLCGGPGIAEALAARGAEVVRDGPADAVVVGFHRDFDYERMSVAARAVRAGARLLASNDDAAYPTPEGLAPGAGAILASVARAAGDPPVAIAGKGHPPMLDLVRDRLGVEGVVVGDRPDTDGRFAVDLRYRFALVLSGVTVLDDLPVVPTPDLVADDLAAVVDALLPSR